MKFKVFFLLLILFAVTYFLLKHNSQTTNYVQPSVPTIIATPISNVQKTKAKVVKVIDGDTIKLDTGQTVRYIGMDTPEMGKTPQCFASEATQKNKELVEGKEIYLEKDVSEVDKYNRLLRYIWVGDTLVDEVLVRDGFAKIETIQPDIKYQQRLKDAQTLAKNGKVGLWNVCFGK